MPDDKNRPFYVMVQKATHSTYWYNSHIGVIFPVIESKGKYLVIGSSTPASMFGSYIDHADAVRVTMDVRAFARVVAEGKKKRKDVA
jgi:hypothetical protein